MRLLTFVLKLLCQWQIKRRDLLRGGLILLYAVQPYAGNLR
jgi:uncharacterized SAM-binding protein YcdF (DUF218 family)